MNFIGGNAALQEETPIPPLPINSSKSFPIDPSSTEKLRKKMAIARSNLKKVRKDLNSLNKKLSATSNELKKMKKIRSQDYNNQIDTRVLDNTNHPVLNQTVWERNSLDEDMLSVVNTRRHLISKQQNFNNRIKDLSGVIQNCKEQLHPGKYQQGKSNYPA
jgi:chromosome segregation ATPase